MPRKAAGAGSSSDPPPESPLPTSPRSLNRQAKLHRLLKQLHSHAAEGSSEAEVAAKAAGHRGALGPLGDGTEVAQPANCAATAHAASGGRKGKGDKRKREDEEADGDESSGVAASGAGGGRGSSSSSSKLPGGDRPPPLQVDVDAANGERGGSGGGRGRGRGRGGRRGGRGRGGDGGSGGGGGGGGGGGDGGGGGGGGGRSAGSSGVGSSSQQPQPNFRGGRKGKRPQSANAGSSSGGPQLSAPRCIFKNHHFTSDPPPEVAYEFSSVPAVKADLAGSVLLRPVSRRQWFVCIQELESLAQESLDRRAARLSMNVPSGLPLVYIADRMDIDDPLWGYQLRCESTRARPLMTPDDP